MPAEKGAAARVLEQAKTNNSCSCPNRAGLGAVGGVGLYGAGQIFRQDAGGVVHAAVLLEEEGLEAGAVGQGDAAGDQQIGGCSGR